MRLNFKYKASAVLCGLFLLTTAGLAQDSGKSKSDETELKVTKPEKKTAILFPEVEGWQKSEKTVYPVPELGYSYTYQSGEGGRVTVYVYNGGLKTISDDINDKNVKGEFNRAKNEILMVAKSGTYENLKEIKTEIITIGGGKLKSHYALLNFSIQGQKLASELYLFSYQNNFIKIRATRPKTAETSAEFNELLTEIASMFEE